MYIEIQLFVYIVNEPNMYVWLVVTIKIVLIDVTVHVLMIYNIFYNNISSKQMYIYR